jgi:ribosomal protein S18 acetylase RimI-like enzyme
VTVRHAGDGDVSFVSQDEYLSQATIRRKIEAAEVLLAEVDGVGAGYLRIEYLWSKIPYITLIRVLSEYRQRGVGKALLAFLEAKLRDAGHELLLSSSEATEPAPQAWHRHMGFEDCGRLEGINADGVDEVFFRKGLRLAENSLTSASS